MAFDGIALPRLRREVGTTEADDEVLTDVIKASKELLLAHLGSDVDDVPEVIFDQAHLATAADMFNRRKAPNGVLFYAAGENGAEAPLRISNDPLRSARAILKPWTLPGFA